jgi:hypothetical protein
MKKIKLSIMAMLLLSAVACKKSDNTANNVSNDDVATMVAGSISFNANGTNISDDPTFAAANMTNAQQACGTTKVDSILLQSTTGAYSYNYKLKYNYTLNCNANNQYDNVTGNLVYSGSFSGPNLSSTNSGTFVFTVAGFTQAAPNFVIDGEYKRSGSFKSKIDTTNTGTSNIDIVIKALSVRKPARTIAGGTATISVTGNVPKKGNFSFSGTMFFNGDGTATLTIGGTAYIINITTGLWTKV